MGHPFDSAISLPPVQDPSHIAAFSCLKRPGASLEFLIRVEASRAFNAKDFLCQAFAFDPERRHLDLDSSSWKQSRRLGRPYVYLPDLTPGANLVRLEPFCCAPDCHTVVITVRPWRSDVSSDLTVIDCFSMTSIEASGNRLITYRSALSVPLT